MMDELAVPESPLPPPSLPWHEVWSRALRNPSVVAYERLLEDPKATLNRAVVWLLVAGLIGSVFSVLGQFAVSALFGSGMGTMFLPGGQALPPELGAAGLGNLGPFMGIALVCGVPVGAVLGVLAQLLYYGILHFAASAFGGQGGFGRLVYANAAYSAPVALISSLLGMIPCVGCLALPLAIYSIALQFIATKAATGLGWGSTIASILLVGLLFVLVGVVIVLLILLPFMQEFQGAFPTI